MSELEFWKDLGNIFDAVLNYQKKNVEFNNRFINPWIRLGNIFERQDQTNDAVHAYQRATEIDPDSAHNWVDLGDAQFKNAAYDEAIDAYRKAVTLDPEAGWPVGNLALSLVSQGKIEEAIPLYMQSISLLTEVKDKAICWNRLGNAYRKINDYENAFLAFQKADLLDGENTGFSDKLDEIQPNTSMIAPEEVLEQMREEQILEISQPSTPEVVTEPVQDIAQSDAEPEIAEELVALAPNMEMVVEEIAEAAAYDSNQIGDGESANNFGDDHEADEDSPLTLHEKNINILEIVKEVINKVELVYSQQEEPETEEALVSPGVTANDELHSASEDDSASIVEIVAESNTEAMVEPELLALNETAEDTVQISATTEESGVEVISEAGALVPSEASLEPVEEVDATLSADQESVDEAASVKAPLRAPAWLVMNDNLKALGKGSGIEANVQAESVTTLSEISQEGTTDDLSINLSVFETYTNSLTGQLATEPVLDEEPTSETVSPIEVPEEAEKAVAEMVEADESNSDEESTVTEEFATIVAEEKASELAYEEYLMDLNEGNDILKDHVDDIQGEAPLTKVSKNGEVRIAMDTKNAHVWNELGNIYLNAGACDDAVASYSKAIELDRHFAWPYSNLALAYVQKGRFAEAILLYQRGIEIFTTDKDKAITWNRLGNVYRRINDYNHAIAAYQTADELDPENATLSLRSSFGLLGNIHPDSKPAYVA